MLLTVRIILYQPTKKSQKSQHKSYIEAYNIIILQWNQIFKNNFISMHLFPY